MNIESTCENNINNIEAEDISTKENPEKVVEISKKNSKRKYKYNL